MTFAPSSRAAAAALLIVAAQIARSSFACACAPCPEACASLSFRAWALDVPAACRPEPEAPCCGEQPPPDAGSSCACPHIDAVEGLPIVDDVSLPSMELAWESPPQQEPLALLPPAVVSAPGPAPPVDSLPLYLRDLSLRL